MTRQATLSLTDPRVVSKGRRHAELARIDSLVANGLLPGKRLLISGDRQTAQLYSRVEVGKYLAHDLMTTPSGS